VYGIRDALACMAAYPETSIMILSKFYARPVKNLMRPRANSFCEVSLLGSLKILFQLCQ
jgi:hypothetical protein